MTRRTLWAIGVGVYVLALIGMAPASLVDAAVGDASNGRLRVAQARGTLWSGDGQLEVRDSRGYSALARPLTWRLQPLALLGARLAYVLELGAATPAFPLTISWSRIELANVRGTVPASALAAALPKLAPYGLSGDLDIQISRLAIGAGVSQGSATVQWRAASSLLSPVAPLGDYQLHFEGDGARLRSTLHTVQGPLQLDGQGSWPQGDKPVFVATARMPPPSRQQLAPFLRLIAVERGDGSFEWRLK